jgi:hypothetical protein
MRDYPTLRPMRLIDRDDDERIETKGLLLDQRDGDRLNRRDYDERIETRQ